MGNRLWWEKFYFRDFHSDLLGCRAETKGVWLGILTWMWDQQRGEVEGTLQEISLKAGCLEEELNRSLPQLSDYKIADVINCNKNVIIKCRRLKKDEKRRNDIKINVARFRSKSSCNHIGNRQEEEEEIEIEIEKTTTFDHFWTAYPKKIGKKAALKSWNKAKDKPTLEAILEQLSRQKKSDQWTKDAGQYIPNPATWINQGRWDDETNPGPTIISKPISSTNPFIRCPKCSKETTKADLSKFNSCPACFKPATPEQIKTLLGGIK